RATAGNTLRQAWHSGHAQDTDRSAFNRRGRARGTRRDLSLAEIDFGISRHGKAQVHLYRQSAAADQSGHRTHPHVLSPGGGGDRKAVVSGSESAKYSDPHSRGTA